MEIKNKHVAVALNEDGKCEFVAKVRVINDRELNRLINEKEQIKSQRLEKEKELKEKVCSNQEKIRTLKTSCLNKTLFIAKSTYDNFVDRGLIDDDDTFQKMWYDYYFNDGKLDLKNAPQEYKTILAKVVTYYEEYEQDN